MSKVVPGSVPLAVPHIVPHICSIEIHIISIFKVGQGLLNVAWHSAGHVHHGGLPHHIRHCHLVCLLSSSASPPVVYWAWVEILRIAIVSSLGRAHAVIWRWVGVRTVAA